MQADAGRATGGSRSTDAGRRRCAEPCRRPRRCAIARDTGVGDGRGPGRFERARSCCSAPSPRTPRRSRPASTTRSVRSPRRATISRCASRSCWRSSSRSPSIRTRRRGAPTRRSSSCANAMSRITLARALISQVHRRGRARAWGACPPARRGTGARRPARRARSPRTRCSGSTGSTISRRLARATACTTSATAIAATSSAAAEMVEFLAMAEFRAGNWAQAEQALEDACETLAQFDLRGPFVASFADRSVIDAHRGRIERARRTLLGILDGVERLDVFWRMVCHSAQGAVEFCAGDYAAADRAWTADAGGGPGRRLDRLPGRPQRAGPRRGTDRARQAGRGARACSSTWSGGGARCHDRGSMPGSRGRERSSLAADGKLAEALADRRRRARDPCVAVRDCARCSS